ncbi:MAG: OmpH family outer membrane protein [Bacteroidetes bacterium]|nr:OmpH family outer membrane protein [Bacteroidota bacterium]
MKTILGVFFLSVALSVNAQQRIGHVNSAQLLDTLTSYKEAGKKLDQKKSEEIAKFQTLEKAFQAEYNKLMEEAPEMPKLMLEQEQQKLMLKQQELENFEPEMTRKLQMYQKQYMEPILERTQKAIAIVAERKKLNYIFDETVSLYFKGGIDCTAEVMTELLKLDAEAMKNK